MQDQISRRTFLTGIGGVASGAGIAYVATDDAQATQIQVDTLDIADAEKSISEPLNGLQLNVNGSWDADSDSVPSKIVLRVKARANTTNDYQQIQATDYRSDLEADMSRSFTLSGNLLDLEALDAPSLTPQEAGESVSENISVRIVLEIYHDSTITETHTVEDSATLDISRELAQTNATISASGNLTVRSG